MAQSKPFVLNGVGKAYVASTINGVSQLVPFGTLQDIKISFSGSTDKVYGGDGLSPIYIINKDQDVTVTASEARFSLEHLNLVRGAKMSDTGSLVFDTDAQLVSGTTLTISGNLTTVIPEQTSVIVSDDDKGETNAKTLVYVAGTPKAGQFTVTTAGKVTFGDTLNNKYVSVSGLYTGNGTSAAITTASLPSFVTIRHKSMPIEMDDGTKVVIHTIIYKARSTGKLDVDFKRQAASTSDLEFEVFDSGRKDGVVVQMTQEIIGADEATVVSTAETGRGKAGESVTG
jgi:hypothetical protein